MTSVGEINLWLKGEKYFMGCYEKNNLPTFTKVFPKTMIVKCDNHFIGLLLCKNKCFYFDSYGNKIIDNELISYLSSQYDEVFYSSKIVQDKNSINCGQFCSLFVKLVHSKSDYLKFLNIFNLYYKSLNDFIVVFLLKKNKIL